MLKDLSRSIINPLQTMFDRCGRMETAGAWFTKQATRIAQSGAFGHPPVAFFIVLENFGTFSF